MKKTNIILITCLTFTLLVGMAQADITINPDYTITGTDALTFNVDTISLNASIANTTISVTANNLILNGTGYVLTNVTLILTNCNNITLTGWTITNTTTAIIIAGGTNNTLTGNTLSQNQVGLYLTNKINETTVPLNATIYLNNFYNNNDTIFDLAYSTQTQLTFTNGTHGNFWYTYTGADVDLNGIGDTPYTLTQEFTDNNPLMSPAGQPLVVVPEFTHILLITGICFCALLFFKHHSKSQLTYKNLEVKKCQL